MKTRFRKTKGFLNFPTGYREPVPVGESSKTYIKYDTEPKRIKIKEIYKPILKGKNRIVCKMSKSKICALYNRAFK